METKAEYVKPVTFLTAQALVDTHVCSICYGHLIQHLQNDGVLVICAKCGPDTRGYVTKKYAERRQQESMEEKLEAKHVLKDVIKSPSTDKSEAQLLHELGF